MLQDFLLLVFSTCSNSPNRCCNVLIQSFAAFCFDLQASSNALFGLKNSFGPVIHMELWAWKTAAISILVSLSHFGSFGFSAYLLFCWLGEAWLHWVLLFFLIFCWRLDCSMSAWIWSISALLDGWGKLDFIGFLLFFSYFGAWIL